MGATRERSPEADNKSRSHHHTPAKGTPAKSMQTSALDGIGNRALLSLMRSGRLQAKARVSKPDDPRELEAERVADAVLRMEDPSLDEDILPATRQRAAPDPDTFMRACAAAGPSRSAPTIADDVLRSSGQPLDKKTRDFFEPRFQRSFDGVRIHTGSAAAESARSINAFAYTYKNNIVFGADQYAPDTSAGRRLLAHELTHVAQNEDAASGMILPYRRRSAPAFDEEKKGEQEFKNAATQPWIELISVDFTGSKADPDNQGFLMATGKLEASYHNGARKPIRADIVGGSAANGLTDQTSTGRVHRIEGFGYNHLPLPRAQRLRGMEHYAKSGVSTMSYAVYINPAQRKQAIHYGSLKAASLSCVHLPNLALMRQINFHSVERETKVVVRYNSTELAKLCCSRIKFLVQVEKKKVRKKGEAPNPCNNQDPRKCP